MISIIICSINKTLLNAVSESIKETIGVPYEIIAIDNSAGKYGICKAYNLGAAKAKYDIFCFMHEDITFETQNWGQNVVNHLKDESIGLIGAMGAYPTLKIPSCYLSDVCKLESNFIHVDTNTNINSIVYNTVKRSDTSIIKEVTAVDGALMITRRNVFNEFKYDDILLTGFHGYDIEYSLQVKNKYKVCVVFDLVIKHFFNGGLNKQYIIETIKVYIKWQHILPITILPFTKEEYVKYHWLALNRLVELMISFSFNWTFILKQFIYFSFNKFFKFNEFISIIKNQLLPKFYTQLSGSKKLKN